jgi:periplasmic protein TonB
MINFNQNLYKIKWLDLVFQNRNKTYGAYQLRQHNADTTVKALVIGSILFVSVIISPWIYNQFFETMADHKDIDEETITIVDLSSVSKVKPVTPAAPKAVEDAIKVKTVEYPPMVIKPADLVTSEAPTQIQLTHAAIGSVTIDGKDALGLNPIELPASVSGAGITEAPKEDVTVYDPTSIEAYPEFPGGMAAFTKYMGRNLRFPEMAIEGGIQGRVIVSFIIEKNGDLSNIKIIKGIGAGCDEEAIRVLAKSPKWKAGIQNKQYVRVAYTIPINFQLPE